MAVSKATLATVAVGAMAFVHQAQKVVDVQEPNFTPYFNKDTMPKTPTALVCVFNLSAQFFLVYTGLAIARTCNQLYGNAKGACDLMGSCASTVNYCPMLAILFLGLRMRAIQLSGGDADKYGLPSDNVKLAMNLSAWAVLAQVLMVLVMPVFTGELSVPVDADGNVDIEKLEKKMNKTVVMALTGLKYVLLFGLYVSSIYVVYGVYTMEAPTEVYENTPPVSPAIDATVNLTAQFFFIYFGLACVRSYMQVAGPSPFARGLEGSLSLAAFTVNMAPMLCVLFIGARMRALQIDPKNGAPQPWAQNAFYMCTYSIMVQALLVVVLPMVSDVKCVRGDYEGDVKFSGLEGIGAKVLTVVRYGALLSTYVGFSVVVYSIFAIKNEQDPSATPPLSSAMACVCNLVAQYFTIYLALFVANTCKTHFWSDGLSKLGQMMEHARATVMYAPMLAILFVGTRIRSLELARTTDGTIPATAGPQLWAQECMFLSTWAVLIQVILVIGLSMMYPVEMDEDGNVKTPKDASKVAGYVLNTLRYASMISMYGGACAVMYAASTMTPGTILPYSKQPLIPGVEIPAPVTPPQVPAPPAAVAPAAAAPAAAPAF